MNTLRFSILLLAAVVLALAGCSSPTPTVIPSPTIPPAPPAVATPAPTTALIQIAPTSTVTATLAVSITIGTPIVPAGQATAPTAQATNPLDTILNAEQAALSHPVRITTVVTGSATPGTFVVEFVPPDRFHLVQQGGMEVISIKSQGTWLKFGGTWQRIGFDISTIIGQFDLTNIQSFSKNIITGTIQTVGQDTLNGRAMTVYTFTSTVSGIPGNFTSRSKMSVGASDGLPYQVISDTPNPLNPSANIHTVSTYQYDSSIKVSPPA